MKEIRIPYNRPSFVGTEAAYIEEALRSGRLSGDGAFTRRCQAALEKKLGAEKVLLTTSCTDALEMCALLLDLQPGDEVVLPSFTFVSTANAFALRRAVPVFADIRTDTLNLDEERIEPLITPRTRAIVVVHYAGVACEMDRILEIAGRHGLAVVEDNAHGLFGTYRGRNLGTLGSLATLSFHETKNLSCGEGGALVVNDGPLAERAEILWEKGTNRKKFFRGEVDKYTWVDLGSSFLPADLLAAVLYAQLEAADSIQSARRRIWETYRSELDDWALENGVALPVVPYECGHAYHLFHLLMPTPEERSGLIGHLADRGILAVFHYQPLHDSPMGRRFGAAPGQCPVATDTASRIVRLPFYNSLTESEQAEVIRAVRSYRPQRGVHAVVHARAAAEAQV